MDESKVWITTLLTGGKNDGFFVIARAASPWQSREVIHVKSKKQAQNILRSGQAIECLWTGVCNLYMKPADCEDQRTQNLKDEENKVSLICVTLYSHRS